MRVVAKTEKRAPLMSSFNISITVCFFFLFFFYKGLNICMKVLAFLSVLVLWFLFFLLFIILLFDLHHLMDLSLH